MALKAVPQGRARCEDHAIAFFELFESAGLQMHEFRYVVAAYPFIITLRLSPASTSPPASVW